MGTLTRWGRGLVLVAAMAVVAGCGGDSTGPSGSQRSLTGTWSGSFNLSTLPVQLEVTLTDAQGTISGEGTLSGGTLVSAVTVAGSFKDPNFNVVVTPQGFQPITFTGTATDSTMDGAFNRSGFVGQEITLARK